jgi:3-hydroxy acid dehydrogenase/malonic semialdehyde reductase
LRDETALSYRHGMERHVVVTGASSGIGAATAEQLARTGARISIGARRRERLADIAADCDPSRVFRASLDVTDESSVEAFLAGAREAHGPIDALVNNAGLARGVETVSHADGVAWQEMIDTNITGLLHVTRRVVAEMTERGEGGHVVMVGSIAGREPYEGGSVYCATKHAVGAITKSLRYELLGTGIRVGIVDPGMVETEFSLVRFRGDTTKAAGVYDGMRPLTAGDVADCIVFMLDRPAHVCIDEIFVMPTDQGSAKRVSRST